MRDETVKRSVSVPQRYDSDHAIKIGLLQLLHQKCSRLEACCPQNHSVFRAIDGFRCHDGFISSGRCNSITVAFQIAQRCTGIRTRGAADSEYQPSPQREQESIRICASFTSFELPDIEPSRACDISDSGSFVHSSIRYGSSAIVCKEMEVQINDLTARFTKSERPGLVSNPSSTFLREQHCR